MIIIEGHRIPGGDSKDGLRPLTLDDCRNYHAEDSKDLLAQEGTKVMSPSDEEAIRLGRRASVLSWIADSRGYDASAGVLFWRSPEGWVISCVDSWAVTSAQGDTRDNAIRDLYERTRRAAETRQLVEDRTGDRAQLAALGEQVSWLGGR